MLRKPQLRLVVTFPTTAEALKTEQAARAQGVEGRLIPVPRQISAGCGLAWSGPPETEHTLRAVLEQAKVETEQVLTLTI